MSSTTVAGLLHDLIALRYGVHETSSECSRIAPEITRPQTAGMKFILSSTDGVYVVQPIDSDGNSSHAIGINCFNRTIYDSAEQFAMNL
jgi:nitrous oxidase accessory protein NosD